MNRIEQKMSKIAGYPVALTIRGDYSFTFSFDVEDAAAGQRIADYFAVAAQCSVVTDECGTFVYVEAGR